MKQRSTIRFRSFGPGVCVAMGLLLSLCTVRPVLTQTVSEEQVKAAYLFSFTKFVEWPEGTFANASDPIRLCVFNDKPFVGQLNQIVGHRQIAGHPVLVVLVQDGQQSRACQELFIGASQNSQIVGIIDTLRTSSVLTVGETDEFVEKGGMISFVVQGGHVQFRVNQRSATQSHLRLSSQLLSVAKNIFK